MQAPDLSGIGFVFMAGVVFIGLGWLVAPSLLTFLIAFVVFDLSLAASKVVAIFTLGAWILLHLSYLVYRYAHTKIISVMRAKKHEDFMRMRNIFYYSNAVCTESYESLRARERRWLDGEDAGCNVPDSPLRCEGELRDEVGSWLPPAVLRNKR